MESEVSFAPLRPADFVNFAGRGKACFSRGGAACFSAGRGGAGRPSLVDGDDGTVWMLQYIANVDG